MINRRKQVTPFYNLKKKLFLGFQKDENEFNKPKHINFGGVLKWSNMKDIINGGGGGNSYINL